MKEWSIQEIAKLAGTTSRTLRHYGELRRRHGMENPTMAEAAGA